MHKLFILPLLAACLPGLASAADLQAGQSLHDGKCVSCHGSEVYTRADRRVSNASSLRQQVQRCDTNLELGWFDEEINNVAHYLNESYYKFEQKSDE